MNWFIPKHIREGSEFELQRARLFVQFAIGFGSFGIGFSVMMMMMSAPLAALYNLILSLCMVGSPLLLRWTGSLNLGTHALVGSTAVLMIGLTFLLGGIHSPNLPVMAVCPMMAAFLMGRRMALFWVVVVLGTYAVVYLFDAFFDFNLFSYHIEGESLALLRTAGLATLAVLIIVFVLQYDSAKDRALSVVSEANQRMATMIAHLDATSTALSQSAAEFLGSEGGMHDTASAGLTQQMLTTAESSRAMIHRVRDSIGGMIEQYNQISIRIRELHEQSGTIAEMVRTIDSISDRLDLMALNTGIEAANAGVAGQRFKLLADDMRRLAERVLSETTRIKASIRMVQKHTKAATDASLAGQALTDEGVAQLHGMSQAFDEMFTLIEHTADASKRITSETMSQLSTIHALVETALLSDPSTTSEMRGRSPDARRQNIDD